MTSKCCGNDCEAKTAVCELSTELSLGDVLGTIKVRLGIGRMHYTVAPGLYKIGAADENSPVLVTANFKLTVDILRRELTNRNIWLVVVDTNGINVWCAAGKGTFGTAELVAQLEKVALKSIVAHKTTPVKKYPRTEKAVSSRNYTFLRMGNISSIAITVRDGVKH